MGAVPPAVLAGRRGRGQPGPGQRPGGPGLPHLDRRGAGHGRPGAVRREVRRCRSASSRSATTPASCAAAPTWPGPATSGLVKILGESSIGSGVRRVEALVGIDAFRFLARESVLVSQLSEQLKARREELPERISSIVTRLRDAERDLERLQSAAAARRRGRARQRRGGRGRRGLRGPPGTRRHAAATGSARSPWTCAAGWRPIGPAWSWWPACPPTGPRSWWPSTTRPGPAGCKAGRAGRSAATGALGGRGGGKDDVAQGGGAPLGDRRRQTIAESFRVVAFGD